MTKRHIEVDPSTSIGDVLDSLADDDDDVEIHIGKAIFIVRRLNVRSDQGAETVGNENIARFPRRVPQPLFAPVRSRSDLERARSAAGAWAGLGADDLAEILMNSRNAELDNERCERIFSEFDAVELAGESPTPQQ